MERMTNDMKIAFIYPGFESLGIEYISAILKQNGHHTYLLFDPLIFDDVFIRIPIRKLFSYHKTILKRIEKDPPDIVLFSVVSDNFQWAIRYAKEIKGISPDIKIVFGGQHATAAAEYILKNWYIDFVVRGEGEYCTLELVNAIENEDNYEDILNLGYKKNGKIYLNKTRALIQDLDLLPFPDKELFLEENPYAKKEYNIITTRGCPHACSYCHNSMDKKYLWNRNGRFLRRRSMENIIQELRMAKEKYNIETLCIWDEVFTYDEKWLEEFAKLYKKEINIPFWTFIHPAHITKRTVEILEEMGCWEVEMGVQTLNSDVKKNILKRYETKEQVIAALDWFADSKIRLVVDVIFGLPELTEEDYIEIVDTFNQHRPSKIQTFWLRYYPGTDIVSLARDKSWLSDDEIEDIYKGVPTRACVSGGTKIIKEFQKYQTILVLMPFLSKKRVNKFINSKAKRVPPIAKFGHIFTRAFDVFNKYDVGGRRYIGRLKYFILKKVMRWI